MSRSYFIKNNKKVKIDFTNNGVMRLKAPEQLLNEPQHVADAPTRTEEVFCEF